MTVFTLTKPKTGFRSIINGKLLEIRSTNDYAEFINIQTKEVLLRTTKVINITRVKHSLIIRTESGSVYEFIDVSSLIPTKPTDNKEELITLLNKKYKHRDINYGDRYDKTTFTFNRGITEEEFRKFLKENNYKIKEKAEWWNDYSTIEGKGNTWIYKWVRVYTD